MYKRETRIRFSEVDKSGFLTMGALLRLFQDLIFTYVADKNLGEEYTAKTGCTWFRLSWQIDVIKMPRVTQRVTLSTHITEVRQSLVYMEIEMRDEDGNRLAIAEDMLAYYNIEEGTVEIQDESIWPHEDFGEKSQHLFRGRKIAVSKANQFSLEQTFKITRHMLDLNGHANNVRLIEKALEICGLEDYDVKSLRAEFKNQILPEWDISAFVCETDGVVKVEFKNEYGLLCNVFEFSVLDYVDFI